MMGRLGGEGGRFGFFSRFSLSFRRKKMTAMAKKRRDSKIAMGYYSGVMTFIAFSFLYLLILSFGLHRC